MTNELFSQFTRNFQERNCTIRRCRLQLTKIDNPKLTKDAAEFQFRFSMSVSQSVRERDRDR